MLIKYDTIYFDDLGVETTKRHFGKRLQCHGRNPLITLRFVCKNCNPERSRGGKTHATTNLNAQELEERYGNRGRSRMRQMFNLISFDAKSVDKRS